MAAQPVWTQGRDHVRRDLMLARMAQVLGLQEQSLRERLMVLARRSRSQARYEEAEEGGRKDEDSRVSADLRGRAERLILQVLMAWPERIEPTSRRLPADRMLSGSHRRLYEKLVEFEGRLKVEGVAVLWSHLDDEAVASLATDLVGGSQEAEQGENREKQEVLLEDALATLNRLSERDEIGELRRVSASDNEEEVRNALRKIRQLKQDKRGFLPPGMTAKH